MDTGGGAGLVAHDSTLDRLYWIQVTSSKSPQSDSSQTRRPDLTYNEVLSNLRLNKPFSRCEINVHFEQTTIMSNIVLLYVSLFSFMNGGHVPPYSVWTIIT